MGSTFTLYADFNLIDGGSTSTKNVTIGTNTQVIGDGGVIFDNATVALVDGVLQVELPDNTNDPFDFGYTVRRATGLTKTWRVPVQEPGVRVLLTTFTSTTPLPLPPSGNAVSQTDFTAYQAEAEAALADETTRATDSEALLAPKASPALTGTPTAPTATPATNSTRIATTAYTDAAVAVEASARTSAITAAVTTAVNNLLAGTPGALDTLKELADALGDDPSFATTITNLIAAKVPQSRTLAGLDLSANRSAQELVDALGSVLSASFARRLEAASYTYNSDGTVATETVGGFTTTYTYNADGTVATATRNGVTLTYSYNADSTVSGAA